MKGGDSRGVNVKIRVRLDDARWASVGHGLDRGGHKVSGDHRRLLAGGERKGTGSLVESDVGGGGGHVADRSLHVGRFRTLDFRGHVAGRIAAAQVELAREVSPQLGNPDRVREGRVLEIRDHRDHGDPDFLARFLIIGTLEVLDPSDSGARGEERRNGDRRRGLIVRRRVEPPVIGDGHVER